MYHSNDNNSYRVVKCLAASFEILKLGDLIRDVLKRRPRRTQEVCLIHCDRLVCGVDVGFSVCPGVGAYPHCRVLFQGSDSGEGHAIFRFLPLISIGSASDM